MNFNLDPFAEVGATLFAKAVNKAAGSGRWLSRDLPVARRDHDWGVAGIR